MLERASLIIKKLQQLVDDNASSEMLLTISQMLVVELQQIQDVNAPKSVSVTLPRKTLFVNELVKEEATTEQVLDVAEEKQQEAINRSEPEIIEPNIEVLESVSINESNEPKETIEEQNHPITWFMQEQEAPELLEQREEFTLELPEDNDLILTEEVNATIKYEQPLETNPNDYLFESTLQIPTLPEEEIVVAVASEAQLSEELEVNNKFREQKVEVAHLLENTHIKDLRKAISINDKYLFINELFAGDEALYERSIKQIQSYSILPEAIFWIQRELKIKLNWSAENEVVQLFDQLVRRRFS